MAGFDPARHVAATLPLHAMSHATVAARTRHSAHMRDMTAALLRQPAIGHAHLAALLGQAVRHGALTQAEAAHFHNVLPADPRQLRGVVERMHQVATHANDALHAEMGARLWGGAPGSSRRAARH